MLRALMAGFPSEATIEELTSARTIIAADPPDHTRILEARSALGKLVPHLDRFDLDLRALERNPYMLLHGVKSIPLTAHA